MMDVDLSLSPTEQRRLLERIRRTYDITTEPLQIGPISIEFTRVADPNRVLDEVAREEDRRERLSGRRKREDELHLPYWAELWESSLGLAHYLVSQWSLSRARESALARLARETTFGGRTISAMDLGCGMGLAGVVAARLGMRVLFADLEPPALLFARYNARHNTARCRTRRINWQKDRLDERFDVILGADIVYDRSQWAYLNVFLAEHLLPGGAVIIGEPGRSSGQEFEPWITLHGWQLTRREQPLPGRSTPIVLLELTRKEAIA